MKLKILALAALAASAIAAPAFAETDITATLAKPVAVKAKLVAGGAVWRCEGTTCITAQAPDTVMSTASCRALAQAVGPITAYASGRRSLSSDVLARCNAGLTAGAAPKASR
jgi:hypothetical protein